MALAMAPVPARAKPSHGPKAAAVAAISSITGNTTRPPRTKVASTINGAPGISATSRRQRRERGETPSEYQRQDQEPGNDDLGEAPEAPRPRPLPDEGLEKGRRGNW